MIKNSNTVIENLFKPLFWWVTNAIWLTLVVVMFSGMLNKQGGGLRAPEELLAGVHLSEDSNWMGIYLSGQKIGYVHTEIEPLPDGDYEISEYSRMQGAMMGQMQHLRMSMTVITDSTLALVSFKGRLEAEPYTTEFVGNITENVLAIEITAGGRRNDKFIPASEPIYLSQAIKPLLQAGRLEASDSLRLAGFDPMSLEMQELMVIGADLTHHSLWNEEVLARKLTTRLSGFESTVYVDSDGNVLAEFGPLGIMMRKEEMEVALSLGNQENAVDFLAIYSIKPTGMLRAPRKATSTSFRLSGIDLESIAACSDRQSIAEFNSEIIRIIQTATSNHHLSREEFAEYTQDAPYIESRDKSITEAAAKAVSGALTLSDSLDQLTSWVFRAVNKKPAAGLPSAIAVLNQLEGDCNEHSVLFTALARSIGIPTRIQLGVVYQAGRFFYHAWPASWIDGHWREIDPTFGQFKADAARISLASGDLSDSVNLIGSMGKIEIQIMAEEN